MESLSILFISAFVEFVYCYLEINSFYLQRAAEEDASLVKAVSAELQKLEEMKKEKDKSDGTWLRQAFAPA